MDAIRYGRHIRDARKENGFRRVDAERYSGIRKSRIRAIEKGTVMPEADDVVALADAYGITIEELIKG